MRTLAIALLLGGGACVAPGGFPCVRDADCAPGRCEPIIRECSFVDTTCDSGRRFGEHAAENASQCVAVAAECGKTVMFTDAFDTAVRNPLWSTSATGTLVAQPDGRLVFTLVSAAGSNFAHYITRVAYDLTGSRVFIEAPVTPNPAGRGQGYLQIFADSANSARILVQNGMLSFSKEVGGVTTLLGMVPYQADLHRFWQLREQGGTLYWETSADGTTWDPPHAEASDLFDLRAVKIQLTAGTSAMETAPGQMVFDAYNGGLPSSMAACPIERLVDDFADVARAPAWLSAYTVNGCTMNEAGGALVMTPAASMANSYCAYLSGPAYDLGERAVSVRVDDVGELASVAETYLAVIDPATGDLLRLVQQNGKLHCQRRSGGDYLNLVVVDPYVSAQHRWWRIRHAGAEMFCEASADGVDWTFSHPLALPFPAGQVRIEIGAGTYLPVAAPGTMRFAAFNLPP